MSIFGNRISLKGSTNEEKGVEWVDRRAWNLQNGRKHTDIRAQGTGRLPFFDIFSQIRRTQCQNVQT